MTTSRVSCTVALFLAAALAAPSAGARTVAGSRLSVPAHYIKLNVVPAGLKLRAKRARRFKAFNSKTIPRSAILRAGGKRYLLRELVKNGAKRSAYLKAARKSCVPVQVPKGESKWKSVCLRTALEAINKAEQAANKRGYSIRDKTLNDKTPAIAFSAARTKGQLAAIRKGLLRVKSAIPTVGAIRKLDAQRAKGEADALKRRRDKPSNKTVKAGRTWTKLYGNKKTMAIELKAWLKGRQSHRRAKIEAGGSAEAWVFNNQFKLISVSATVTSDRKVATASVSLKVVGKTIANPTWTQEHIRKTENFSKSVDHGVRFLFWVGPVPAFVKLGVQGTAGIRLTLRTRKTSIIATAKPYVRVNGYVSAGVDILIAAAWAKGTMNLLTVDFPMLADLSLVASKKRNKKHLHLVQTLKLQTELTALKGDIKICGRLGTKRFGFKGCKKLISWGGITLGKWTIWRKKWREKIL